MCRIVGQSYSVSKANQSPIDNKRLQCKKKKFIQNISNTSFFKVVLLAISGQLLCSAPLTAKTAGRLAASSHADYHLDAQTSKDTKELRLEKNFLVQSFFNHKKIALNYFSQNSLDTSKAPTRHSSFKLNYPDACQPKLDIPIYELGMYICDVYPYAQNVFSIRRYAKHSENTLINAPYLLTVLSAENFSSIEKIVLDHVEQVVFQKLLPKNKGRHLRRQSINALEELRKMDLSFAFDGGAETACESPTHRLLIYSDHLDYIHTLDFDDC